MTLNQKEISDGKAKNVTPQSSVSNGSPMSSDKSTSPASRSQTSMQLKRELSWQVANNLLISFKYAWAGVSYAFRTQRNFRIHVAIGTLAIGLGFWLELSAVKISVIVLTIGAVLGMELLNTAIESVVDLTVEQSYHELAKIAKDCAAAAVLISAIAAIFIASCLLLPPLWLRVQSLF